MANDKIFFGQYTLEDVLKQYPTVKIAEIKKEPLNKFCNKAEHEIYEEYASKYMIQKIELSEKEKEFSQVSNYEYKEQSRFNNLITTMGKMVTFSVPFTGNEDLFNYNLNYFTPQHLEAEIRENKICYDIYLAPNQTADIDGLRLAKEWYNKLKGKIEIVNKSVDSTNEILFNGIKRTVSEMMLKALSAELETQKLKSALKDF